MFEYVIENVFKITGRGYILGGFINDENSILKMGEVLIVKGFKEKKLIIKGIKMLKFGNNSHVRRLDPIGLLVDISDEEANELKGKVSTKITID